MKHEVLIIDDNSPDLTFEKVKQLKKEYKNIYLKVRNFKSGLDTAHKEAYEYALKNDYDYLITMDADLSDDPSEINNFIKYLDEFPFVIGSRYIEGGKCEMKGRRLMISKVGNKFIKRILNINCHEFTTSFRGFNLKKLKRFHLNLVSNKLYFCFQIMNSKNLVIIPTFNEVENILIIIDKILNLPLKFDILVVDDNSPDGTARVVAHHMEKNNKDTNKAQTTIRQDRL